MAISEESRKSAGDKTNQGYGGVSIILGACMVWQGVKHGEDCPNGAAHFLYVGGIITLIVNGLGILAEVSQKIAMKDGKISGGEKCGLFLLSGMKGVMALVNLIVTIWGSIVVFAAYTFWSYAEEDIGKAHYCPYTPMVFAFAILIIQWILIPVVIGCACLATICALCAKAA